jgi:hypothetical protein
MLIGTWTVDSTSLDDNWVDLTSGHTRISVKGSKYLTRVGPPRAPEPPVGSVVWAGKEYWQHTPNGWFSAYVRGATWSSLAPADDLSPVVPVSRVAEWLRATFIQHEATVEDFLAEFGWPKDGSE